MIHALGRSQPVCLRAWWSRREQRLRAWWSRREQRLRARWSRREQREQIPRHQPQGAKEEEPAVADVQSAVRGRVK